MTMILEKHILINIFIRICGKSELSEQFINYLKINRKEEHIIQINLEADYNGITKINVVDWLLKEDKR